MPPTLLKLLYRVAFHRIPLCLTGISLLVACQGNAENADTGNEQPASQAEEFITVVEVDVLQTSTFTRELVSNGKLQALRKSRISFPFSETLTALHIRNGDQVQAGQLLATLDDENLQRQLQQAELSFARASLDMQDILLGRGFTLSDSLRVPAEVWQMAGVRSGYSQASLELQRLKSDLARTRITAPFSGQVVELESQVYEQVTPGQVLCTLIDNTAFLAQFPVMENDLALITPDAEVEIIPFASLQNSRQARIQSINPQVDEHGRVEVSAIISDTRGLMEGMNVKVMVKSPIARQLVVPHAAVMYRDNLEVLFKYTGGKAEWTYVKVLHQNSTHYSVMANPDRVASLQPGDTIIVSGNLNLAHGSLVKIQNP